MDIPIKYRELEKLRVKKGSPRNEREEQIDNFFAAINRQRQEDGYTRISYGRLLKMFEKVPTQDLYPFFKRCQEYGNFNKAFFGSFKKK